MVDANILACSSMAASNSGVNLGIPFVIVSETEVYDVLASGFVHVVESVAGAGRVKDSPIDFSSSPCVERGIRFKKRPSSSIFLSAPFNHPFDSYQIMLIAICNQCLSRHRLQCFI